ncbi:hypothetical protein [Mycobacteroides abscessus]|uniref:hypothetical protein n=1 Tax=Mycobacteroides abscessus TaxID=36809 RepID=UPI0019D00BBD|nr:hypothetical protein [Mycobacteroides abscessus]MBN7483191.1 hypothetical protein [Mycobacteroides abscessus subsp. massiliense]
MMKSQTRPRAMKLVGLALALSVGTVGCSSHPTTPTVSSSAGESSVSASARQMVDVSQVWATHPLPDCPKPPIERNGGAVPAGIELPTESTVSEILGDVKSPASEAWVRTKLGWVTQWLLKTRADIITDPGVGADAQSKMFSDYVSHVRDELQAGRNIERELDGSYPEECQ